MATRYRVRAADLRAHLFEVACSIDSPDPSGQVFRLPAWIPGSYVIREFARHFVAVRAESAGAALTLSKLAKDAWRVAPCTGPLTFIATIYAFDLSVRAAYLDTTRGYFNGTSVFVWPEGHERLPCSVDIIAPADPACSEWRVATTLPRETAAPYGFGMYRADDYDALIDHPVEIGRFALLAFDAGGARHELAITGARRVDGARLERDLARVCQAHADLFGGAPQSKTPFERYLFQVLALPDAYGGLEHRMSTSLVCKRTALPQPGADPGDDYQSFLGLASHEYFHAWNVKRIKPAAFQPYDLGRENYTRLLWAFEGVTSYYDDLALVRSGAIGVANYLEILGRSITTHLRTPARHVQSIADASFDAWIKHYHQDENAPNAITSYYTTGSLVALALDLTLRQECRATLDDVMRALWQRYGACDEGVPENGVEALVSEVAQRDLAPFFDAYVRGTDELPLAFLLAAFGVRHERRAASGERDRGGTAGSGDAPRLWLGARLDSARELRVRHVLRAGPAEQAGLAVGDIIVAVDSIRASVDALDALLRTRSVGERIEVLAFRRDELVRVEIALEAAPLDTCWLALDAKAAPEARDRRVAWLRGR